MPLSYALLLSDLGSLPVVTNSLRNFFNISIKSKCLEKLRFGSKSGEFQNPDPYHTGIQFIWIRNTASM